MTARQLMVEAHKCAHNAAKLMDRLYDDDLVGEPLNPETVTTLLEQARGLNAAAQALENIARKYPEPVRG